MGALIVTMETPWRSILLVLTSAFPLWRIQWATGCRWSRWWTWPPGASGPACCSQDWSTSNSALALSDTGQPQYNTRATSYCLSLSSAWCTTFALSDTRQPQYNTRATSCCLSLSSAWSTALEVQHEVQHSLCQTQVNPSITLGPNHAVCL